MKKRIEKCLAFLPLFLLMGGAYLIPILSNITNSLRNDAGEYVGFQNYADVWNSYYFLDSFWFTLKIALVTTIVSTILAVIVAMALRETFVGKNIVLFLFQYNLCVPHMAVAMMMVMLLSQTGALSMLSNLLGLTEGAGDFPWLVRDSRGIGIALTFIWKYFPYIGLSALGILQGASLEYEHQAAVLGVGKYKRFFYVILPNIIPVITVAMIMVFTAAFGEYEIPALLGSSAHRSLSMMIYMKFCDFSTRNVPQAYAMMSMMVIALMAIIVTFYVMTSKRREADQ